MLERSGNRRLFLLSLALYAIYGITATAFGAALPRIIADYAWSYTTTGLVLAAIAVGTFVSSFVMGLLLEKRKAKPWFIGSLIACAAGIGLFGRSPSPGINIVLCLITGASMAVFEIVVNFCAVRLEKGGQSRIINLLHAGFSIGAVAGPIGLSFVLSRGSSWTFAFPAIAALYVALAVFAAVTRFFEPEPSTHVKGRSGIALLRQPVFLMLCLAVLFYVGSEIGASNWIAEYFVKVHGTSPGTAAYAVSALWAGLLVGRTLVSALFHRVREEIVILALCLLSIAALFSLTFSGSAILAIVLVFVLGLGYSAVYPLLMSITGKEFRTTASVGMFTMWAGLGSFTFPFLLAGIAERAGLRSGFLLLAILPLGTLIISVVLARMRRGAARRDTARG